MAVYQKKILLKILKDISTIGIGDIVGSGVAALFWFYLASIVNPVDYGQIHYLLSIGTLTSTFTLIGTQNVFTVYIAKNKTVVKTLLSVSVFSGIFILIICYFVFDLLNVGLLILGIILFTYGISSNLGKKSFKKFSFFTILQKSLTVVFALVGYHYFGIDGVIYGIALSYFVYLKNVIEDLRFNSLNYNELKFHICELKINKNFILTNYFWMLTNGVTNQVDKILIVPILGLAILGNYSLALQLLTVLTATSGIIFKFLVPHAVDGEINKKLKQITILSSFGLAFLGIVVVPILIPIFFEKYTNVIDIIQIMSLSVIPITINLFYYAKFLASENGKVPLYAGIISSSIMTVGMLSLGSLFEAKGIAITHVIAYSTVCPFLYYMNKKLENSH
jgi:O-antigen/teichoic acid export membrane protein